MRELRVRVCVCVVCCVFVFVFVFCVCVFAFLLFAGGVGHVVTSAHVSTSGGRRCQRVSVSVSVSASQFNSASKTVSLGNQFTCRC